MLKSGCARVGHFAPLAFVGFRGLLAGVRGRLNGPGELDSSLSLEGPPLRSRCFPRRRRFFIQIWSHTKRILIEMFTEIKLVTKTLAYGCRTLKNTDMYSITH